MRPSQLERIAVSRNSPTAFSSDVTPVAIPSLPALPAPALVLGAQAVAAPAPALCALPEAAAVLVLVALVAV